MFCRDRTPVRMEGLDQDRNGKCLRQKFPEATRGIGFGDQTRSGAKGYFTFLGMETIPRWISSDACIGLKQSHSFLQHHE